MKTAHRIIVALDVSMSAVRSCLQGVIAYTRKYCNWNCHFSLIAESMPDAIRRAPSADGMIIDARHATDGLARLKTRVIAVGIRPLTSARLPRVNTDLTALARLAADHLYEHGFRRFAYYAFYGDGGAIPQGQAFLRAVEALDCPCEWLQLNSHPEPHVWWPQHAELTTWVKKLAKPVGIFTWGDPSAQDLAMACRDAGISVPEQVAILGVGNDELRCTASSPELSSIDIGAQTMGFEAAKLLDRMLTGLPVPKAAVLVPPLRVVARGSTDVIAAQDPLVVKVVRYIHDHLGDGISVKQLMRELDVSRRNLEMTFQKHLGRTVHEEIVRVRMRRAAGLLETGNESLERIRQVCGICDRSRLHKIFKHHTGMTPLEYRKAHQRKYF